MMNRLFQMVIKEFRQMMRDPRSRFWIAVLPVAQILLYGYAATFELHHARMAMLDRDHSRESRELIARIVASGYFSTLPVEDSRQIHVAIERGQASLAMQILPGFSRRLHKGETAHIELITDGTDSNIALIALGYVSEIAAKYGGEFGQRNLLRLSPELMARIPKLGFAWRPWFNPDVKSRWFMVPGTIGALLLTSTLILAVFAIVREREAGTLEQLMVTPITPMEFILGKTIPAFIVSLVQLVLMMIIGPLWFRVPFHGAFAPLAVGTAIYVLSVLGIAVVLSTLASSQQQALIAAFFFMLPAILLSGFGWPIENMPVAMQWITYLDPLRYYLVIIRGCFLEGTGWKVLWPQMVAIAALASVLLAISIVRFHKSLE